MSWFKIEVLLFMLTYASFVAFFVLGRWRIQKRNQSIQSQNNQNISDLSIVVPFRDEALNLEKLILSIENLTAFPKEILFINDHSTDQSVEIIKRLQVPFRILQLPNTIQGKKAAIQFGVNACRSNYILTWDADIEVPPNYFSYLATQSWSDLTILPVEMRGSTFVSGFFAMDYQLQVQANVGFSAFFRPITASGANLLFKKSSYNEVNKYRKDAEISSGDDQFLLKAMRDANKSISLLTQKSLKVVTQAPKVVRDGFSQRLRWLSKARAVNDPVASFFGVLVLLVQLCYYSFAFHQLYLGAWGATIVMILIKGELDAFICTYKFQEQFNSTQVFFYQLLYPFYMLGLIFFLKSMPLNWKGRTIKKE